MVDLFSGQKVLLVTEYSEDEKAEIRKIADYIQMLVDKKRLEQSKNDIQT